MKLAYLFSRYPVPSQTFCDTEIRALEARGFEIEIFSCSPPTTSFRHPAADRPRARVSYAPPPTELERWERQAARDGRWPANLVAEHERRFGARYEPAKRARHALFFADLAQRRGIDHLHVHFANRATHAALFWLALTGGTFSFTAHAQDFLIDLGSDELLAEMTKHAAFVVAVSDWSRDVLAARCPAAREKIRRIHNGLSLDRWPEPPPPVAGAGALRIFSAGRLIEFKGFADLIASCARLRESGIDFRCEIAGEGPERAALERRIAANGLGDCVHLAGLLSQTEIRARLAECDVFALACRMDDKGATDVLPTVILEAMAAGRPAVSTRLAGVPELVLDGETGLLVDPGDVLAFAEALTRLAADPVRRARLGRAARVRVVEHFNTADSAEELEALFAEFASPPMFVASDPPPPILCLSDDPPPAAQLRELFTSPSAARWISLSAPADEETLTGALEFLPDAIVLESAWREETATAHRIESLREAVGGSCPTEEFLLAARRALCLTAAAPEARPLAHIHASGPGAFLCAWLLVRLGAASGASFFLPLPQPGSPWARTTARRLGLDFVRGWIPGDPKLALSLGPRFVSTEPNLVERVRLSMQGQAALGSDKPLD